MWSKQALDHAKWTTIDQVMVKKKIQKKFLLTVAYDTIIFPTNTVGKKLQVKHMQNLMW